MATKQSRWKAGRVPAGKMGGGWTGKCRCEVAKEWKRLQVAKGLWA